MYLTDIYMFAYIYFLASSTLFSVVLITGSNSRRKYRHIMSNDSGIFLLYFSSIFISCSFIFLMRVRVVKVN